MESKTSNLSDYLRCILMFFTFLFYLGFALNVLTFIDSDANWRIHLVRQQALTFYTPNSSEKIVIIYLIDYLLLLSGILLFFKKRLTDIIALIFVSGVITNLLWENYLLCDNVDFSSADLFSGIFCIINQNLQLNSLYPLLLPLAILYFLIWKIINNSYHTI